MGAWQIYVRAAHNKARWYQWAVTWAFGDHQSLMVPLSVGLAVRAFFMKQGPFDAFL